MEHTTVWVTFAASALVDATFIKVMTSVGIYLLPKRCGYKLFGLDFDSINSDFQNATRRLPIISKTGTFSLCCFLLLGFLKKVHVHNEEYSGQQGRNTTQLPEAP